MFYQPRSILSPKPKRLIFTPIKQSYTQKLKKITTWVKMGEDEKKWASPHLSIKGKDHLCKVR